MSTPNDDVKSLKNTLRQQMRASRSTTSPGEREAASRQIRSRTLQLLEYSDLLQAETRLALYLATPGEPDLDPLIARLQSRGVRVLAPYFSDSIHAFHEIDSYFNGIVETQLGNIRVRAPREYPGGIRCNTDELDIVLLPGLAFDNNGHRLGQGGGWYDRVLSRAVHVLKVGICFDFQMVANLPHEAHDQPVNFVVTEKRTLEIRSDGGKVRRDG